MILTFSSLLILLSSFSVYSQEEDKVKTEMVRIDLKQLQVNNDLLCLLDTFVLNKDFRTGYRKDYVHRVWADSRYCVIMISLQRKSVALDEDVRGIFWRNDIPFVVVGGDNPNDLFTQTGGKECFCFERTTIDVRGEIYDYPLNPEEFITWVFKHCHGTIEFVDAQLDGERIRSNVNFSFEQPCCP
ncbi:hypothetical protein FACS189421_13180 [Bacteroidia bacterium]|nr:hypothetical protein FACS189421_13180 [Bacteroidia bacterium]